jgi:hypothetical protein
MSIEELSTTSGVDQATSGAEVKPDVHTSGESEGLAKTLEKALKEKRNAMEKSRELEAQLKKLSEEKLVQNQQWKDLAEQREKELIEVKQRESAKDQKLKDAKINSSLRNELLKFGMNAAMIDYALRLVDKSKIQVDPETEVVLGADQVAKEFHSTFSGQSFFGTQTPGVSHKAPDNRPHLTGEEAFKAELRQVKSQKELEMVLAKHNKI